MKLGLKQFIPDVRDLKFKNYRTDAPLPKHPASFGHESLVTEWGMLGNDQYGDCVWAGAAHETMLWNAIAGKPIPNFTDEAVLSDYAAVTGFNPETGDGDNGTDMRDAAKYRQSTGIVDADGNRHKIGAYVWVDKGDFDSFLEAVWLFGSAAIGFQVPQSAEDQFGEGKVWDVVKRSPIIGGHYIPGVADRAYPEFVTWAKIQPCTKNFYMTYVDTAVAYLSEEFLADGKSPEGFSLATLQYDLDKLGSS